jgi:hypothetical protein
MPLIMTSDGLKGRAPPGNSRLLKERWVKGECGGVGYEGALPPLSEPDNVRFSAATVEA